VACEEDGQGIGRIRMRRIPNATADSLQAFVQETIERGSLLHTDGLLSYDRLEKHGYRHRITFLRCRKESASELLPRVHRVVSLLKRWLLGTHQQGAVSRAHLDYYLDEFTFRFNRRTSRHRGSSTAWCSRRSLSTRHHTPRWSGTCGPERAAGDTRYRGDLSQGDTPILA
jgi:transposase-like protein